MPQEKPTVYLERNKGFIDFDDVKDELFWMKKHGSVSIPSAVAAIVRVAVFKSSRFRTRSSKLLGPEWIGEWEVEIWDESNPEAFDRIEFELN